MKKSNRKFFTINNLLFVSTNITFLAAFVTIIINLFNPTSFLEWTAIVLMSLIAAPYIAEMNRKDIMDDIYFEELERSKQECKKSA